MGRAFLPATRAGLPRNVMIEAHAVAEKNVTSFDKKRKVDPRAQALRQDARRLDVADRFRPYSYHIGSMQPPSLIYDDSGYWRVREDLAMVLDAQLPIRNGRHAGGVQGDSETDDLHVAFDKARENRTWTVGMLDLSLSSQQRWGKRTSCAGRPEVAVKV